MKKKIEIKNLNVYYGADHVLKNISLKIRRNEILSIIGPSTSGKSTFLKCLNRLIDTDINAKVSGVIKIDGKNILAAGVDVNLLRKNIGMIFAVPVPLPMSIFNNLTYGPYLIGVKDKEALAKSVRENLTAVGLWDEVKDRLDTPANNLSGGQQQRLCLARTLMVSPQIILFDEPCSGLDPISTAKVESSLMILKKKFTIILVTNNTKQAARVAERTAFFLFGELVEEGQTTQIFTAPRDRRTNDYITGRFG